MINLKLYLPCFPPSDLNFEWFKLKIVKEKTLLLRDKDTLIRTVALWELAYMVKSVVVSIRIIQMGRMMKVVYVMQKKILVQKIFQKIFHKKYSRTRLKSKLMIFKRAILYIIYSP